MHILDLPGMPGKHQTKENVVREYSMPLNPVFDEFDCFHLQDFDSGDAIRVRKDGQLIRGEVVRVDNSQRLIIYRTAESMRQTATVDEIVSLEPPIRGFLR